MLAGFQVFVGLQQSKLKRDDYMLFPATDYRVSECSRARGICEFYRVTLQQGGQQSDTPGFILGILPMSP